MRTVILLLFGFTSLTTYAQELDLSHLDQSRRQKLAGDLKAIHEAGVRSEIGIYDVGFPEDVPFNIDRIVKLHRCSRSLQILRIYSREVDPNALKTLANFRQLTRISISSKSVDDRVFAFLAKLPHLTEISLSGSSVGEGIDALASSKVEKLGLANVKRSGLEVIGKMTWLKSLGVGGEDVNNKSLELLSKLENLESLSLAQTGVSKLEGLVQGEQSMPMLIDLNLFDTAVDDRCIDSIKKIPNLATLDLARTRVTDAGLLRLIELKETHQLKRLHIARKQITDDTTEKLRKAFPEILIDIQQNN